MREYLVRGAYFQFLQTPSNKKLEVMTVASNYHIEVNASDAGIYDRIVVMELIKNAAQTHQLDTSKQREFKGTRKLVLNIAWMSIHTMSFSQLFC